MSKSNATLDKQRKRFKKVLDYLKNQGISQQELANKCNLEPTQITSYKSGKIQFIPDEFLKEMQKHYNINPKYIRLTSERMFDIIRMKFSNFETFVDSWDTVEKLKINKDGTQEIKKYLHFKMDKNFYNFLVEVDTARLAVDAGISCLSNEIENLNELFSGEPDLQEYVLLPKNNFIEILEDNIRSRKSLNEIVNFSKYESYLDE